MRIRRKISILLTLCITASILYGCGTKTGGNVKIISESPSPSDIVDDAYVQDGYDIYSKYTYQTLDERQQIYYQCMLNCILTMDSSVTIEYNDYETMKIAFEAIRRDYGGLFWVDGFNYETSGNETIFYPIYSMTEDEVRSREGLIEAETETILNNIDDASDYGIAKGIYEYLVENVTYNRNAKNGQNILGVFLENECVCSGYASATQFLFSLVGIESIIVTGTAGGENHAWNVVNLDGKWYNMDVTFGATDYTDTVNYLYMTMTDDVCYMGHTADKIFQLPTCISTDDNYFVKSGSYFTSENANELRDFISNNYSKGQYTMTFLTDSEDSLEYFRTLVLNDSIQELCPGATGVSYDVSVGNLVTLNIDTEEKSTELPSGIQ